MVSEKYSNIPLFIESENDFKETVENVNKHAGNSNVSALKELLDKRVNNKNYRNALSNRDELHILLSKMVQAQKDSKNDPNYNSVCEREYNISYRNVYEHYVYLNNIISDYKSVNAMIVQKISEILDEQEKKNNTFLTFEADTIGSLVAVDDYDSGSVEWYKQRSSGVGGSDVGPIMKLGDYGYRDYAEVFEQKVYQNVPETNVDENDYFTVTGRGHAWEEYIRRTFAEKNPELRIAFCKTSWAGTGEKEYVHANFDGLELDENNNPIGIVEIKTGVHSDKWGNTRDGYAGIPEQYRKQVLWYAYHAGLTNITLVAILDDYDYREYFFRIDDPRVQKELSRIIQEVEKFWEKVIDEKEKIKNNTVNDEIIFNGYKGFSKDFGSTAIKRFADNLMAYMQQDSAKIKKKLEKTFTMLNKEKITAEERRNKKIEHIIKLYSDFNPDTVIGNKIVGIDLETSSRSARTGRIIQLAIIGYDNTGETKTIYKKYYGLPEKALNSVGFGAEEVHHINYNIVKDNKTFNDPNTQKIVLEVLKKAKYIVAHNANFEKSFLKTNLDGFAEAIDNGEIVFLDTAQLTKQLMPDTPNNKLETFAEYNGVQYIDAHDAEKDTIMMMKALRNFSRTLYKEKRFIENKV